MGNYFSSWFQAQDHFPAPEHFQAPELKDGVERLNDSVFQLYKPPSEERAEVDVIFFHGLQVGDYRNAYWDTWSSDGGATAWPRTLLAERALTRAQIMSVSYDSSIRKSNEGGRVDLFSIAENLVKDIIESDVVFEDGSERPVILVGHSLGGLVIKKFLLMTCEMTCDLNPKNSDDAQKISRLENFVRNMRGVFYYGTPHHGSKLADVASRIPGNSEVLVFLETLSKETERLNERFRKWRKRNDIRIFSIAESLPTRFWGINSVIVAEASVRHDYNDFYTAAADHISVCKPQNMTANSFALLRDFIRRNAERDGRRPLTNLQEASLLL